VLILGFRKICCGGCTWKIEGGFHGYSQGMSRHVSGELLLLNGSFLSAMTRIRMREIEGEREREKEREREGGSAFARLLAYGLSKEEMKRKMTEKRERSCVLIHCGEEIQLYPGVCCCCQLPLPLPHSNGRCIFVDATN